MSRRTRFEMLYEQHAKAIHAYALRRADSHTAEEIVAEVFLVVWRRLDDVPQDALPWLFGTARRVLANRRRGDERQLAVQDRMRSFAIDVSRDEDVDPKVLEALATLGPRDQEVLLLIAWEDLTPAQASLALGIGRRALAMRLHRAKRRLAAALTALDSRSSPTTEGAVR